jgi:hypothetical protein
MKISPKFKKIILIIHSIILLILIVGLAIAAYYSDTLPTVRQFVSITLSLSLPITFVFIWIYYSAKSNFKEFESKIANVDIIVKAIEYGRVINVITAPSYLTNYKDYTIVFDNGIEISLSIESEDDCELSIADVQIPKYSYLYYIIAKKNNEYLERLKVEKANKRTETIINKMKKSQED